MNRTERAYEHPERYQIHSVGGRKRKPKYLGAVAGLLVMAATLSVPIVNVVALQPQQASAVVVTAEHNYRMSSLISKSAFLEFDKGKNLEVQVEITSGVHKGEIATAHYSALQMNLGLNGDLKEARQVEKGTRVDITYTQRRLTDQLRVEQLTTARTLKP